MFLSFNDEPTELDLQTVFSNKISAARWKKRAEPAQQRHGAGETQSITTSLLEDPERLAAQLTPVHKPRPADPKLSLQPLQEWEGYVVEVKAESFTASLVDVTADQKVQQELGEFPVSDLSDDDRALLREGAIFRWVVGYQRSAAGTKRRVSELVFRRLPAWTKPDLERARERAESFAHEVIWE